MGQQHDRFVTLCVVYRDEWMLAVDKPAGILVHGDGTDARTLTDLVREECGCASAQPVQRLDVDTTGLVLFSLDKAIQPALDALVAGHDMKKRYLAVVPAGFAATERTIDAPIGRDRHDSRKMRVSKTGKPAITHVSKLAEHGNEALVCCELETGRRHQIRVHLASLGYPIVGDALYGGRRSKAGLMLHAWQESFVHPVTGTLVEICTPVPSRMASWEPIPPA